MPSGQNQGDLTKLEMGKIPFLKFVVLLNRFFQIFHYCEYIVQDKILIWLFWRVLGMLSTMLAVLPYFVAS